MIRLFCVSILAGSAIVAGVKSDVASDFDKFLEQSTLFKTHQVYLKGGFKVTCELSDATFAQDFSYKLFNCPQLGGSDVYTSGVYAKFDGKKSERCAPVRQDGVDYVACIFN